MKISQQFVVSRPVPVVWDFFQDIPRVADCLPGAEYLGPKDDGKHAGKVSARVGPFQANFEGEADVRYDDEARTVALEGKGVDRKGASRGRMTMNCRLEPSGETTRVLVDADVQLSGTIAQFGRTGLITEVANVIVADFVRNAERELAAPQDAAAPETGAPADTRRPPARPINGFALLLQVLRGWLRSLSGRSA